jgi:hypothetical protein
MELSKQKGNLFDPFRQAWVVASPEEIVRQKLLRVMTTQLGLPRELLAVETQLSEIPHLKGVPNLPKRRVDIICFAKGIHPQHPLYPLLVIECKEGQVGEDATSQVLGYNHYIQAKFVAIAGEGSAQLIYPQLVPFLPPYSDLCR